MIIVVALLLLGAVDGADDVGAGVDAPSRCLALTTISSGPPGIEALVHAAALLPANLAARVAAEGGRAQLDVAWRLLRRAVDLTCLAVVTPVSGLSAPALTSLAQDPRFVGVRHDDDLGDQLLDRLGAWLERLLESEAMVAFSEQTRTVYLTGLALVMVGLAWRLRRRRRPDHDHDDSAAAVLRREHTRQRAFAALRDDGAALVDVEPRAAMLTLRHALLARLGEVDVDAARPSRTATEILGRLAPTTSTLMAPALHHFDQHFYSGSIDVDAAAAMLMLVDTGAHALHAQTQRSGG